MTDSIDIINNDHTRPRLANYVPLTPISFLQRAARVHGHRVATIFNGVSRTWQETYDRCCAFANACLDRGLMRGEVVSVLAFNTPQMVEMQFSVAMAGGVLNTINTRLDAETVGGILQHAEPRLIVVDLDLIPVLVNGLSHCEHRPQEIIVIDSELTAEHSKIQFDCLNSNYEVFINSATGQNQWTLPSDEWETYGLNYTSGTGGRPKGVLIHHRGAYLMAMGTIPAWNVPKHPIYLYTVPMFHCNGWGHAWMLALVAGTIICTKKISAKLIFDAIADMGVTHFGGAPIILGLLINASLDDRRDFKQTVQVMTAGAPPPPAVLEKTEQLGMTVTQVYGLTETFGHIMLCDWNNAWDSLDFEEKAKIKARQGVQFTHTQEVDVLDLKSFEPVIRDGYAQGEIVVKSNTIMKGYHKDKLATDDVFSNGYFRTGDIAVVHANGYIEVKDRLKDVIISGGENISSVEVENVLYRLPQVAFAAVVAKSDEKWGEVPVAFLELKPNTQLTGDEVINFCRSHLAGFKSPKSVYFETIPKTATGKLQKFMLRNRLRAQK